LDEASLEALYIQSIMAWETRPVSRATLADLDMNMVDLYLTQRSARSKLTGRLADVPARFPQQVSWLYIRFISLDLLSLLDNI
jgi:hypothetical protein